MLAALVEQKQQELAAAIARMYDKAINQAIVANGWPLDVEYIKGHIRAQPLPDGDRLYHDGVPFWEIVRSFDYSDPAKISVTITSKPINHG